MANIIYTRKVIVTYSYRKMFILKGYATTIISFTSKYSNYPDLSTDDKKKAMIRNITGHRVIKIIDSCVV